MIDRSRTADHMRYPRMCGFLIFYTFISKASAIPHLHFQFLKKKLSFSKRQFSLSSVSMSSLQKLKSGMRNPDRYVLMVSIYLERLLMMDDVELNALRCQADMLGRQRNSCIRSFPLMEHCIFSHFNCPFYGGGGGGG